MRVPLLAILIASLLLTSAGSLYAACTSPSAPIGSQNWNGTAFQYCDGTTWQNFAGSQWSDGASSAIYYNSGNVGIGTSAPAERLHLSTATSGAIRFDGNTGGSAPALASVLHLNSNIDPRGRGLYMTTTDAAAGAAWFVGVPYNGGGFQIGSSSVHDPFAANSSGYAANAKLFINAAGNVGIGTGTPLAKLDVRSGSILAGDTTSTNGSVILQGYYSGSDTTAVFGTQRSSGAPVLGYGVRPSTSAAGSFLSSVSTALPRAALVVGDAATGTGEIKFYTGSSQTVAPGSAATLSPVLTILNGGNVGIGTTVPGVKLHVTGNSKIETGVLDLDPGYSIRWGGAASGIYSGSATSDMVFTVGSSERFRVNGSSGHVGIGTTNPSTKLHVAGSILGQNDVAVTAASNEGGRLSVRNSAKTGATTSDWSIWNMTGAYGNGLSFWRYYADGTNAGPSLWLADGGNIGIGTTAPSTALDLNGAQTFRGMAAPAVSPVGQGRIYYDTTANKFRASQNGGAYADLVGGAADNLGNHTATTTLAMGGNTISGVQGLHSNADRIALFGNRAADAAYEWLGFYSGNTRQAIVIYDGAWDACSASNAVCFKAENGNNLHLKADANVLVSAGGGSITLTGAVTASSSVTATSFAGSGASLTALNASNLASGTVPTARLGSGTANSTTYLRGDNTWASPTAAVTAGTLCGLATSQVGAGYGCDGYTSHATCNGVSLVGGSCPAGYTFRQVVTGTAYSINTGDNVGICARTCSKN